MRRKPQTRLRISKKATSATGESGVVFFAFVGCRNIPISLITPTGRMLTLFDQPAGAPEIRAAFSSVDPIQAQDFGFGCSLRGQNLDDGDSVLCIGLVDRCVEPHNRIDMWVLRVGSVRRSFHCASLGQWLGKAKLAKHRHFTQNPPGRGFERYGLITTVTFRFRVAAQQSIHLCW